MAEGTTTKRVRRSAEERLADIDQKIKKHQESIKALEKKKQAVLRPKKKKSEAELSKEVLAKAKKAGLTAKDIAEKLGLPLEVEA